MNANFFFDFALFTGMSDHTSRTNATSRILQRHESELGNGKWSLRMRIWLMRKIKMRFNVAVKRFFSLFMMNAERVLIVIEFSKLCIWIELCLCILLSYYCWCVVDEKWYRSENYKKKKWRIAEREQRSWCECVSVSLKMKIKSLSSCIESIPLIPFKMPRIGNKICSKISFGVSFYSSFYGLVNYYYYVKTLTKVSIIQRYYSKYSINLLASQNASNILCIYRYDLLNGFSVFFPSFFISFCRLCVVSCQVLVCGVCILYIYVIDSILNFHL